jgi:hypothetical protein
MTPGGRLNIQTAGFWVLQFHDEEDNQGNAYDETNRPINFAARYEKYTDEDEITTLRQVAGTKGPIGGWMCLLGDGVDRDLAYWAQAVPAKITSTSPLRATPIATGDGSGWTEAEGFEEVDVFTADGSTPDMGAFGVLLVGTEDGAQNVLFFEGGSGGGGSTVKCFKVTVNNGDGTYEGVEYDEPNGTLLGDLAHPVPLDEDNDASGVPVNQWVRAHEGVSTRDIGNGDGEQTIWWFSMPFGCET